MRILFCILLLSAITNFATAQQTSPQSNDEIKKLKEQQSPIKQSSRPATQQVTPEPTPTKIITSDNTNNPLGVLGKKEVNVQAYEYLGLDPSNATTADYNAAKKKLYYEQPEKYEALKKLLQNNNASQTNQNKKHVIKRSDYNAMSSARKVAIDASPERYQIID